MAAPKDHQPTGKAPHIKKGPDMKIICPKSDLLAAIRFCIKAVAVKPNTPLLAALYLKASHGMVEMHGNNNEIGFIKKFPAEIIEEGEVALTGRYFQEIVSKLPGDEVTLAYTLTTKTVSITSGGAAFRLLSMDASAYPQVMHFHGDFSLEARSTELHEAVKKTVFACSTDISRPIFTAVSFQVRKGEIILAATNAHRLSVNTIKTEHEGGTINMLVPARILNELQGMLPMDVPEAVRITCSFNTISFEFGDTFMSSRLLEGSFPDFTAAIPKSFKTMVHMQTAEFAAAMERVSLIARSSEYNVVMLDFKDDAVTISSVNKEVGEAKEAVAARIEGDPIAIAFNSLYITSALKNVDSETMTFSFNAPLSASRIEEDGNESFLYIVTPVRTNN